MVIMQHFSILGHWRPATPAVFEQAALSALTSRFREQCMVVSHPEISAVGVAVGSGQWTTAGDGYPVIAILPPTFPEWLGNRSFTQRHGCRFHMCRVRWLMVLPLPIWWNRLCIWGAWGSFGAAGLSVERVSTALDRLQTVFPDALSWGSNLIHSPNEPQLEARLQTFTYNGGPTCVGGCVYETEPVYIEVCTDGIEG